MRASGVEPRSRCTAPGVAIEPMPIWNSCWAVLKSAEIGKKIGLRRALFRRLGEKIVSDRLAALVAPSRVGE